MFDRAKDFSVSARALFIGLLGRASVVCIGDCQCNPSEQTASNPCPSDQPFGDFIRKAFVKLGQLRPVQPSIVMMRSVIPQVSGKEVVPLVEVIEGGFIRIVRT